MKVWENKTIILDGRSQIRFCHDIWCAKQSLCLLFLDVYNEAREKNAPEGKLWKKGVTRRYGRFQFN